MKNSSMELKFTEDELLLQQLLHSDCVININSIEAKGQKTKKWSFWYRNEGTIHRPILLYVCHKSSSTFIFSYYRTIYACFL